MTYQGEIVNTSATLTEQAGIPNTYEGQTDEAVASRLRVKVFADLNKEVPYNQYGLPEYIYRADLIPAELEALTLEEREKLKDAASIDLLYREGYPTFHDGRAFWSQMEFEPSQYYEAFRLYLQMAETFGFRSLEDLVQEYGDRIRLSKIQLSEALTYYYWATRCKAYDMFKVAAYQKEREARIMATNNKHYLKAERLIGQLETYFGEIDDDGIPLWLKDLTPGVAISALERLSKVQRVALELPANGPSNQEGAGPANASMEVILRALAEKLGEGHSQIGSQNADVSMLLEDPDAARLAQQLVIELHRKGKSND